MYSALGNCATGRSLRENLNYGKSTQCCGINAFPSKKILCQNGCDPYYPFVVKQDSLGNYEDVNTVKDYRILQNEQDPGNVSLPININSKHIRLENNSMKPVLVYITTAGNSFGECAPTYSKMGFKPQFLLLGGQVRDLGVNMPDEKPQFIWLFDPITGILLNSPHIIRRQANQFVIIEGVHASSGLAAKVCNDANQVKNKPFNVFPPKLSSPEYDIQDGKYKVSVWWIMDMYTSGFKN